MGNYIVSARKYRPTTFNSVVGQEHITNTLKNAIKDNKLAQAFLFCGPRGVGKTTCARILAKTINCNNLTEDMEACNECESCKAFNESASFNIFELDAASNNSVEDIKKLIEQVNIPPQGSKYKIYIIDEVHMLSQAAFNAFLKTLEEPPAYAKFILATTEKHKIIPTILSRCQIFDFKRITVGDMAKHLQYVATQENIKVSPDALHLIAQKSEGCLRDALSMFDQLVVFSGGKELTYECCVENLNVLDYTYYFKFVDNFRKGDIPQTLLLYQKIIDSGFDNLHFLTGMSEHFRNLMVSLDPSTTSLLDVSDNVKSKYTEQAYQCTLVPLLNFLSISSDAELHYREAPNKRLFVEVTLMKLARVITNLQNKQTVAQTVAPPQQSAPTQVSKPLVTPQTQNVSPQPAATKPPQIKINTGTPNLTTSIADLFAKISQDEEKKKKPIEFNKETLETLWKEYTAIRKLTDPDIFTLMNGRVIEIIDEKSFKVFVPRENYLQPLEQRKKEILEFLKARTKLENLDLVFELKIDKDYTVVPYTPDEKYQAMLKVNPQLVTLRTVFQNIDF